MGFNFGAFLGGGAKAIKEEADQEREDFMMKEVEEKC